MTKDELVTELATRSKSTKAAAESFLTNFTELVTDTLAAGGDIRLLGFGSFTVSEVAARTGRNPKTGASMQIKGGKRPKFTAGTKLKAAVSA